MNIIALKKSAEELAILLNDISLRDNDVKILKSSLSDLIEGAVNKKITSPVDSRGIPGDFFFNERNARKYENLERAYAHFKFEITGGHSDIRDRILKSIIEM